MKGLGDRMINRVLLLTLLFLGATALAVAAQPSTPDAVVAGMQCKQNSFGSLECEYHVGRSLYFGVVGVGDKDAAITIYASSFDGDYYASVGVLHGCVIVKPGKTIQGPAALDFAFVSPRNGKVYGEWQSCRDAK